jgi:hypothetical protein
MEINTLIADVNQILSQEGWEYGVLERGLDQEISTRLQASAQRSKAKAGLRLSQMGPRCPRALWYSVHRSDLSEPLPPAAIFKYSYGHIIEAVAITLAKAAGHEVEGEQDEVSVDGISGHRDCVIDGCVVDVKSTSSLAFLKFKNKTIQQDDPFGYLEQIDGYVVGSLDDPIVKVKDRGYLWAIDKQLGRMVLYEHTIREAHIRNIIQSYRRIVDRDTPPACECRTVPDGQSGNIRLDTRASYSPYRHACFPLLRTFLYSNGPRYLTHVERLPDVFEVIKK